MQKRGKIVCFLYRKESEQVNSKANRPRHEAMVLIGSVLDEIDPNLTKEGVDSKLCMRMNRWGRARKEEVEK